MIESLLILAIGTIILLWADRKSMKEIINKQSAQIRQLTGVRNEEDEKEIKQNLDNYHYEKIIRQIVLEDEHTRLKPIDETIYEKANYLFYKIYGYKYLGNIKINEDINPIVNTYTKVFDKYIKDIFPNTKDVAIEKIVEKLQLARLEAIILFERWQKFYFIDYDPHKGWIPNYPIETLTIEQFKEKMAITSINVKKNVNTGFLYFECDKDIEGEVMIEQIPKQPMMSKFVLLNSKTHWLLHEEGEIQAPTIIADF